MSPPPQYRMSGWDDWASALALTDALPTDTGRKSMGLAKVSGARAIDCRGCGLNPGCTGSTGESEHAAMARIAATAIRERVRMQDLRNEACGTVCRGSDLTLWP